MVRLRLLRGDRIVLRRTALHPLGVNRKMRRRFDLVLEILVEPFEDDKRKAGARDAVLPPEREKFVLARVGLRREVGHPPRGPHGREERRRFRGELRQRLVLRHLAHLNRMLRRRRTRSDDDRAVPVQVKGLLRERIDLVREDENRRPARGGRHRRGNVRTAIVDDFVNRLQELALRRERARRGRLVRKDDELPVARLGQFGRELRAVRGHLVKARERRVPQDRAFGELFDRLARFIVGLREPRAEDIVPVPLVNDRLSTSTYLLHHVLHLRLARGLRVEREDARLPDVALHLFDKARVDALADLVLERDARLFLLADDARHHLAVDLEGVAADKRALGDRELEIALHRAGVRIGEGEARPHALEVRVLLDDRLGLLDGDRLLVRPQVDGMDHRRPDRRNRVRPRNDDRLLGRSGQRGGQKAGKSSKGGESVAHHRFPFYIPSISFSTPPRGMFGCWGVWMFGLSRRGGVPARL